MSEENSELLYSFVWKIKNFFLSNHKTGESITSPHFIVENLSNSRWYLSFYPKGEDEGSRDYFSIFLWRNDMKFNEMFIDFKIKAFIGDDKTLRIEKSDEDKNFFGNYSWGWKKFCKSDHLSYDLDNWKENVLTFTCDILCKQPSKSIVSGCEAKSKIGFDKCLFEWNLNLSESRDWKNNRNFPFLPVPIEINVAAPTDEIVINIFPFEKTLALSRMILCQLSLLNIKGEKVLSKCSTHLFTSGSDVWTFPSFFTKKALQKEDNLFLRENRFTLRCEIVVANETVISYVENYTSHSLKAESSKFIVPYLKSGVNKTFSALHDDMRSMFSLRKHCDVKLKVNNLTIPAHKAVLAARSPVFSAMFDQDMLENQTGVVDIQDLSGDTLNALLEFIYTESVPDLDYESASNLLMAADKYQILTLKKKCSDFLVFILSVSNVCEVLNRADMIGYSPLKESAMDYVMTHYKQIMSSEQWREWVKDNNILATEVLLKLSDFLNMIKK